MLMLTLVLGGGPALAKKKKKKKKIYKIEMTGIDTFDAVFKPARKMDNKIRSANRNVRKSKKALTKALKLSKGTTYTEGLKELKRKGKKYIKVVQSGGMPRLSVKSAAPDDIKQGVDAVNTLLKKVPAAIKDVNSAAEASDDLVKAAMKFPQQIQSELAKTGSSGLIALVTKVPKLSKTVLRNLRTMKSIPGRAADTTKDLGKISNTIVKTFK